jgi:hypothetical protein
VRILLLLALPLCAFAADVVCVTTGTGVQSLAWATAGSWTCKNSSGGTVSGPPSTGDIAVVGSLTSGDRHTVTISGTASVGLSQAKNFSWATISAWADNGSGVARVTSNITGACPSGLTCTLANGDKVLIQGATGTGASTFNDRLWTVANLSGTSFDLTGSTYVATVTAGTAELPAAIKRIGRAANSASNTDYGQVIVTAALTVTGDVIDTWSNSSRVTSDVARTMLLNTGGSLTYTHSINGVFGPGSSAGGLQPNFGLIATGTSGSPVTITSSTTGKFAISTRGLTSSIVGFSGDYVTMSNIGTSSISSISIYPNGTVDSFYLRHVTCTACGPLSTNSISLASGATLDISDTKWLSSTGSVTLNNFYVAQSRTGTATITRSYFDKGIIGFLGGTTISDSVFKSVGGSSLSSASQYPTVNRCVIRNATDSQGNSIRLDGDVSNTYLIRDLATTDNNPHFLSLGNAKNQTISGNILHFATRKASPTLNSDADGFFPVGNSSAFTHTLTGNVVLRKTDGSGTIYAVSSSTLWLTNVANPASVQFSNNTFAGSSAADHGVSWAEGFQVPAGSFVYYRSNLMWDTTARGNHFFKGAFATPLTDVLVAGSGTNNACYLCAPSDNTNGASTGLPYSIITSVAPGTNDINDVDPRFHREGNIENWAASRGQASTIDAAFTYFETVSTSQYPALLQSLLDWSRPIPTNPVYWQRGYSGTYIGAADTTTIRLSAGAVATN